MRLNFLKSFILFFSISLSALGSELLCVINSDIDNSYAKLTYDWDVEKRAIDHFYQETYENGQLTNKEEINIDGLNNGGIVLLKKDKTTVVRIWSNNFDKDRGGVLFLDTLYNGVNGERKQYELDLDKNNDNFVLTTGNKIEFNKMKFIAKRSKILGIIGIEKIIFSK